MRQDTINPHPLVAVRALPAPGEAGVGLHTHEGTGLWDAVFVLRRDKSGRHRDTAELRISRAALEAARTAADEWLMSLRDASIPFTDVDHLMMLRAGLVAALLTERPDIQTESAVLLKDELQASASDRRKRHATAK